MPASQLFQQRKQLKMADSVEGSLSRQADSSEIRDDGMEISEPELKKCKFDGVDQSNDYKLEERLSGILCCAVCLDVPNLWMYQCSNGHLMCASCLSHLLADARLKDETAKCPGCRCEISRALCTRNLAVEKAISELPIVCQFCSRLFPRGSLSRHELEVCQERLVRCTYARIGCQWVGPSNKQLSHESTCAHPRKTGLEIMEPLRLFDETREREVKSYKHILDLVSYEKLTFQDLQLRPYRTDDFIPKLFYESTKFSAFTQQWSVKARINESSQENPVHTMRRSISFQLVCKSKLTGLLPAAFAALRGPFGEVAVDPAVHEFEFGPENLESLYQELPLADNADCNHLIAAKTVNMRIIFAQIPK